MLFNSLEFSIFFPIVAILYFLMPHKIRWIHLLLSSCVFYMYFVPQYILILFLVIIIDYNAAILIQNTNDILRKKMYLISSLVSNVLILFYFKYFNFLNEILSSISSYININWEINNHSFILPIGLSFHVFQSMGYTIDVYRGKQIAEKHFGYYSLYVMFFPQLVAGPIERASNLIHQFKQKSNFELQRFKSGLTLVFIGLFKKIVIADQLAKYVDLIYASPDQYNGFTLLLGTYFFAFQIYCDFSGYTDIARGLARIFGINLILNFKKPYLSKSVNEFWKCWHISLSSWLRDYIYIPLGGSKKSYKRWYGNILIVFAISGLWHGADTTFLIWGLLHAIYLIIYYLSRNVRETFNFVSGLETQKKLKTLLQIFITFNFITLTWVFFRATDVDTATLILVKIFTFSSFNDYFMNINAFKEFTLFEIYYCVGLIILLMGCEIIEKIKNINLVKIVTNSNIWIKLPVYYCFFSLLIITIWLQKNNPPQQFIYFQF